MDIIFDSIILNLKSSTRDKFNILLINTLINKKQCNKFAKYIKQKIFKSKVLEICYCKHINNIINDIRSLEKIKKFFKNTNYQLINNFLEIKLKHIKYQDLLKEIYNKLFKVYKNYLYRNNFLKNTINKHKLLFLYIKDKILPITISFIDMNTGNSNYGFIRKLSYIKNNNEKLIINNELNIRFLQFTKLFSFRPIFLVSTAIDNYEYYINLPYSIKSSLYANIITKLINIMKSYIELYNKTEIKNNELDNILFTDIDNLSSESESIDEHLLNNCNIINDLNILDSYEDEILK